MRSLVSFSLVFFLLLSVGCSNKEYADNFSKADEAVRNGFRTARTLSREYLVYWDSGLDQAKLAAARSGALAAAHGANGRAGLAMNKLKSPPQQYLQAHAKLVEAYGIYEAFYSTVTSPAGRKEDYESAVRNETRKFDSVKAQVDQLTPRP